MVELTFHVKVKKPNQRSSLNDRPLHFHVESAFDRSSTWIQALTGKISIAASWKKIVKVAPHVFVYQTEENLAERISWGKTK